MSVKKLTAAVLLLSTRGVGEARARRVISALRERNLNIADLLEPEGQDVLSDLGIALPPHDGDIRETVNRLHAASVRCLVVGDDHYLPPGTDSAILRAAPPIIFLRGDLAALRSPGIGFCGSRHATNKGIAIASDIAELAAQGAHSVVSGGAPGVDRAAHVAALRGGGTTVVVTPDGILTYRLPSELQADWDWSRGAIVSQYLPTAHWTAGRAMGRNAAICALSAVMVLVEGKVNSGTHDAGKRSLSMGIPLFTVDFADPLPENSGNRLLLEQGATPLKKSQRRGRPNVEALLEMATRRRASGQPSRFKTSLFGQ